MSNDVAGVSRSVHRAACPLLDIPVGGTGFVPSVSFRRQLTVRKRKLKKAGVTFKWVAPQEMDEHVLKSQASLHQACWRTKATSSNFTVDQLDLHRKLVERSDLGRDPAAIVMEYHGLAIDVFYGF